MPSKVFGSVVVVVVATASCNGAEAPPAQGPLVATIEKVEHSAPVPTLEVSNDAGPADSGAGDESLPAFLSDDYAATHVRRAWLVRAEPVRLSPDGPALDHPLGGLPRSVVVVEEGASLRVVWEEAVARLSVYVARSAFGSVPCRPTPLALASDRVEDPSAKVVLAPGLLTTEGEHRGTSVRLEGEAAHLRFSGWVSTGSLCTAYDQAPLPTGPRGEGLVRAGTRLVTRSGRVVATLGNDRDVAAKFWFRVEAEPGASPGFQAIRFRTAEIDARGWVSASAFKRAKSGEGMMVEGSGFGSGGGMTDTRVGKVAPGTWLRTPESHQVVGLVRKRSTVYYGFERRGTQTLASDWVIVHLYVGDLGPVALSVRRSEIEPSD